LTQRLKTSETTRILPLQVIWRGTAWRGLSGHMTQP
jgi:hypothetical protein